MNIAILRSHITLHTIICSLQDGYKRVKEALEFKGLTIDRQNCKVTVSNYILMNRVGELLEVCRAEIECQEQPQRQWTIGEILDQAWMGKWPDKQMDRQMAIGQGGIHPWGTC